MRLYSYVVARDYGFAPNPFYGCCSLACCKPEIRRTADIGDWVVGTGSHANNRGDKIVFAMKIEHALTFNEYWSDARFSSKRPFLQGSKKQAFGDNIYHKNTKGLWIQQNSHHSLTNGDSNPKNIAHDTQTNRVLVGSDYVYWGGEGPTIPVNLRSRLCKKGPGHKCNFSTEFVDNVVAWIRSVGDHGVSGAPFDWRSSA